MQEHLPLHKTAETLLMLTKNHVHYAEMDLSICRFPFYFFKSMPYQYV